MDFHKILTYSRNGIAIAAVGLFSACTYTANKSKEYFQDKPQIEYENFVKDCNTRKLNIAQAQAKLDSIAYRDLFNSTNATNDSAKIKEFNKIANNLIAAQNGKKVLKNLANTGISVKEYNHIIDKNSPYCYDVNTKLPIKKKRWDKIQHAIDSIEYRKFFKKHNLLNDSNLTKFKAITKKIKP